MNILTTFSILVAWFAAAFTVVEIISCINCLPGDEGVISKRYRGH